MTDMKLNKLLQEKVDELYKICEENGIETLSVAVRPFTKYASFFNNHWEIDKKIDCYKLDGKWFDFYGE